MSHHDRLTLTQVDIVKKILLQQQQQKEKEEFLSYVDEDAHLFGLLPASEQQLPVQAPKRAKTISTTHTQQGATFWNFDKLDISTPVFSQQEVQSMLQCLKKNDEEYWEVVGN